MFRPVVREANRGFVAGLIHDEAGPNQGSYDIIPLGDERSRSFYSEAAAVQLAQRHADTANLLGLSALPHVRKVG